MSSFKFTVELQQHTPLIHFQHDQAGATLRATEVKAKLDKFIFHNFEKFNLGPNLNSLRTKFDADNKTASLYKLTVQPLSNPIKFLLASNLNPEQESALQRGNIKYLKGVPYFAMEEPIRNKLFDKTGRKIKRKPNDIEERDELKVKEGYEQLVPIWGVMAQPGESIILTFVSFNSMVSEVIEKAVHSFFLCTNFGTRQTKGFGSFSVIRPKNDQFFESLIEPFYQYRYVCLTQFNQKDFLEKLSKQFERIQNDYRIIKSGRPAQMKGGYKKAQTFLYGVQPSQDYRWDKRHFKLEINANKLKTEGGQLANLKTDGIHSAIYDQAGSNNWKDPWDFQYKYIRALLGLAEQYEFQTDKGLKNKYKVRVEGGEIERFPSPLIWKIINSKIYLIANPLPSAITNHSFEFTVSLGEKKDDPIQIQGLKTPENFDMGDFLDFVFLNSPEPVIGYDKF